jgi:nucleoside phosphorylase
VELAAAQEMLDEEHECINYEDTNIYTLGRIGDHNIVIACLPTGQTGTNSAVAVTAQMQSTFESIRIRLFVGTGGGVPTADADIRLGDVVVGSRVVQHDFGKETPDGFVRTTRWNAPPENMLNAVSILQASHHRGKGRFHEYVSRLPDAGHDILFDPKYNHVDAIEGFTCEQCDEERVVKRQARNERVMVHYGTIASGNRVMKHGATRDRVSFELGGVLCFEMEAAGLNAVFPCLVIRGICDYADSHKNKRWQPYAAATAASYAKDLLLIMPHSKQSRRKETSYRPPDPSPFFTGREDSIDRLKNFFGLKTTSGRDFVLYGLSGCGKTQICLRFAEAEESRDM